MKKQIFPIVGMHCASCKTLIQEAVAELDGIKQVSVNYATEKMSVEYDEAKVDFETLRKTVADQGSYQLVDNAVGNTVLASPPEAKRIAEDKKMQEKMGHSMEEHNHGIPLDESLRKKLYEQLKVTVFLVGIGTIPVLIIMLWMAFGMQLQWPD
ncbi:MAG TPA: cation transporter, partial [Candidatus Woesebacteria bacterium]|nr:cation transporter [Candidatus Woesebacteria bacterium]